MSALRGEKFGLKKQDSFRKLASKFGDKMLLQVFEKWNIVLCRHGCALFQAVYKQYSIFVPEDKRQHLAR
jgi:hypothetical protein